MPLFGHLSSTWDEIDPDTACVVCISVFPSFPDFGNDVQTFECKGPCSGYSVAMDAALSQGPLLWRHKGITVIISQNKRRTEREPWQGDHSLSID